MIVRELLTKLGFDTVQGEAALRRYDRRVEFARRTLVRFTQVAGAAAVAAGIGSLKAAENYQNLSNKLRLVTTDSENLRDVQTQIFDVSQKARQSLTATTDLYFGLSKASQQYGISQERILRVTETISKLAVLSGNSGASTQAALFQFRQGIQSGTLRGQELNSILEQATPVAEAIARGMGIPFAELRKRAEAGELTGLAVLKALEKEAMRTDAEFAKMEKTGGQAFTQFKNRLFVVIGQLSQKQGTVGGIVKVFDRLRLIVESPKFAKTLEGILIAFNGLLNVLVTIVDVIFSFGGAIGSAVEALGGFNNALRLTLIYFSLLAGGRIVAVIRSMTMIGLLIKTATPLIWLMRAAFFALNAVVLRNPFVLAAVAISAFINEVYKWVTGTESAIERVLGSWQNFKNEFKKVLDDIKAYFRIFTTIFEKQFPVMSSIFGLTNKAINVSGGGGNPSSLARSSISQPVFNSSPMINLTIPPGTNAEQIESMTSNIRSVLREETALMFTRTTNDFPSLE